MRSRPSPPLLRSDWLYVVIGASVLVLVLALLAAWAYDFDDRVRFRVQEAWSSARGLFIEQPVIVPTAAAQAAGPTFAPPATATPSPTAPPTATPNPEATPAPTSTPTDIPPTPEPLPSQAQITGLRHEYQLFNNCGPASLAIALSYWGWDGNQRIAAQVLKPNQDDKNVSPFELYEYSLTIGYNAFIRNNGDVDTLRRFIAAGYPVLVEKGLTCERGERCSDWFGHYSTFTGYDDDTQLFTIQDSYRGPNITMTYDEVLRDWRAFNYLYVVFFPNDDAHNARVRELLGQAADLDVNYADALARAREEAASSTGEDAAFAWFNVGTNLHYMHDYAGAAVAYDQARQIGLPYRMLWYQFGPYRAYYYTGRYQDLADLATFAIDSVTTVPGLEEAYYWRGQARVMMGQRDQAIADFRTALQRHPNYQPAIDALAVQGLTP